MPKNVLITGATSGIGEATARAFAKEGENLILNRSPCGSASSLERGTPSNLSRPKSLDFCTGCYRYGHGQGCLPSHSQKCGEQVHVLVNNAGLALGLTAYQDYEEWDPADHARHQCQGLDDGDTSDFAEHGSCQ